MASPEQQLSSKGRASRQEVTRLRMRCLASLRLVVAVAVSVGTAMVVGPIVLAPSAFASNPTCTGTASSTAGTCSTDGQLDIGAGPLEFVVTGNTTASPCPSTTDVCFAFNSVTLNGDNQYTSADVDAGANVVVTDATGSGDGWNFGIGASQFLDNNGSSATSCTAPGTNPSTSGDEACLPTTLYYENDTSFVSASASGPTFACNSDSTCTTPTNGVTSYPVTITTGDTTTVGTPVSVFDAAANTGMGSIVVSGDYLWQEVPANSFAGTYTNTIEFALASGPSGTL